MKIAAVYDVHGNLPALEAVLQEAKSEEVDLFVFGGDLAWGPMPRETMDHLTAVRAAAVFIRGNADRETGLRAGVAEGLDEATAAVNTWCADALSPEQLRFLTDQQATATIPIGDLGEVLFCHGSPRSDEETITTATPEDRLEVMLEGRETETIVCGHTHAQFDRHLRDGRRIVNPGSVGLPFGPPGAYWALFDEGVELRVTSYDLERAAELFRAAGGPFADDFADHILEPPPHSYAAEKWT